MERPGPEPWSLPWETKAALMCVLWFLARRPCLLERPGAAFLGRGYKQGSAGLRRLQETSCALVLPRPWRPPAPPGTGIPSKDQYLVSPGLCSSQGSQGSQGSQVWGGILLWQSLAEAEHIGDTPRHRPLPRSFTGLWPWNRYTLTAPSGGLPLPAASQLCSGDTSFCMLCPKSQSWKRKDASLGACLAQPAPSPSRCGARPWAMGTSTGQCSSSPIPCCCPTHGPSVAGAKLDSASQCGCPMRWQEADYLSRHLPPQQQACGGTEARHAAARLKHPCPQAS